MPVLATIAAVTFLFGDDEGALSFLDAVSLRARVNATLDPAGPERRSAALEIVDRLELALNRYNSAVNGAVDEVVRRSAGGAGPAERSYSRLTRLDRDRARAIDSVIEYRGQLASLLQAEEWDALARSGAGPSGPQEG